MASAGTMQVKVEPVLNLNTLRQHLSAYSEWLDGQGIIVSDQGERADKRSHDDLVAEFLPNIGGSVCSKPTCS